MTPTGGSNGVDPGLATGPCSKYCAGFGPQCAERLVGQDCNAACVGEVNGFGKKCQTLGIKALNCLSPFFKPGGGDCTQTVNQAMVKCGAIVNNFHSCKDPDAKPAPQPEPDPEPPILTPATCPRLSSSATPIDCFEGLSCPNGVYNVSCTQISGAPPVMSCSCTMPSGTVVYRVLDGSSMEACDTMASLCY
jgi:hypothetical protein